MDELMFSEGELRLGLEDQATKMVAAVEAEPEESLKQADADAWAASLAHHFSVACPELRVDDVWMEEVKDVKVDVSRDQMRAILDPYSDAARNFPGYRVVVHVPFEGEADVFNLRPSQFTYSPPYGRVQGSDLVLTIDYPRDTRPEIDARAQEFIGSVGRWLGFARADIDSLNKGLEQQAGQAIVARRQRIEQRDAHLAQSKIPVRRPGESAKKTYIPDVLVRRPAPSLPQTRADDKAPRLEPVLEERIFEHVLGVIRKQCLHIEQNPRTYVPMGEEDRRNVILSALTTHYDGFTAETDNQGGHTDILARHDGRNLFICECKFWSGAEGFTDTIDQLFGYTGWRDTKLAIVMFVREKGLTGILKKAKTTLAAHPQFVAWQDASSETELRATMHWPEDKERRADLNVFFVHTLQTKNEGDHSGYLGEKVPLCPPLGRSGPRGRTLAAPICRRSRVRRGSLRGSDFASQIRGTPEASFSRKGRARRCQNSRLGQCSEMSPEAGWQPSD